MAKITFEELGETTASLIYQLQTRKRRRPSKRLGLSHAGHKCDRFLWLKFRWALPDQFTPQRLRLLDTGNREERRVIAELKRIGYHVVDKDPETNRQFFVSLGHVGGMLDGKVTGVVEAPKSEHLLELKSINQKGMDRLKQRGLKSAKPDYWAQCQVYMHLAGLERTLFVAVCKNDDSIYVERVKLDDAKARELMQRAVAITHEPAPPAKMNEDYPPCVYTSKDGTRWPCDFYDLCFGQQVPQSNCRTCVSSTPRVLDDGTPTWTCDLKHKLLTFPQQQRGCAKHLTIPPMINAEVSEIDCDARSALYIFPDGTSHQE
jgi:hypothetical protein